MTLTARGWVFPFDQRTDAELAHMARLVAQDIRERDTVPAAYVSWKPADSQLAHFLTEVARRLE
jgi:hypothetical protein